MRLPGKSKMTVRPANQPPPRIAPTCLRRVAWGVIADGGGLTTTGYTYGALDGTHSGGLDVFARTYDLAGNLGFRTQFGTSGGEIGIDIASDGRGIVVFGHTNGALGGAALGDLDLFLRRYAR